MSKPGFVITLVLLSVTSAVLLAAVQQPGSGPLDSDGDGLSDFQETYKYLSDPKKRDTDGDGIPDGDWLERREHQYIIRSVVQVMKPVTPQYLNDDFQDVRVLDEAADYVELEIIHYPFSRAPAAITGLSNWRRPGKALQQWIEPGPSSDWTPAFRKQLIADLRKDGIHVDKLDDRALVKRVAQWLCERAPHASGCTSFITAWDEGGKPYVPEIFQKNLRTNLKERKLTLNEQWEREVSATGMYRERTRGSCTSSAIYLSGCLKALGIPTRTILCIPVIDAGDEREFAMLNNIKNTAVRHHLRGALARLKNSWASHTFNEVFIGNHWHRLNYHILGQGIYDRQFFGLLSHTATFRDWADAEFYKTVGRRQKAEGQAKDIFGFRNPYSTIALRDEAGPYCKIAPTAPVSRMTVQRVYWSDDKALPQRIRENCAKRPLGLIAVVDGYNGRYTFTEFVNQCDRRATLAPIETDGNHSAFKLEFQPGCLWASDSQAHIYLPLQQAAQKALKPNARYRFDTADKSVDIGWALAKDFLLIR